MSTFKAYRFRLEPTEAQRDTLAQIAGSCRYIYNLFLHLQKERYQLRKELNDKSIKFLSYAEMSAMLPALRQEPDKLWLNDSAHMNLQQSLMDLTKAMKGWLTGKTGFPRFKKKGVRDSFRVSEFSNSPMDQTKGTIRIFKLGTLKMRQHRLVDGELRSATISRDGKHWYISLLTLQPDNLQPHPSSSSIGIDLGVVHFATLSTGEHIDLPKTLDKLIHRVTVLQKQLSHKQKGSKNRQKARERLSVAFYRLRQARHDFLHQTSSRIAKNHSVVAMEDLRVKDMTRSAKGTVEEPGKNVAAKRGLNRSIAKQAWSTFRRYLSYKLDNLNGELRLVDPRHTSQTCSSCFTIERKSRKSQSRYKCVHCGYIANADHNAAMNILRLSGLGVTA